LTDADESTADVQGGSASLPVVYVPGGCAGGTMEEGAISLQLTDDGRLILPPGLKLYTADGQEVCSTAPVDGQLQQERPGALEDNSNHPPLEEQDSSLGEQQLASSSRNHEEC